MGGKQLHARLEEVWCLILWSQVCCCIFSVRARVRAVPTQDPPSRIVTPAVTTNTGTQHHYPEYICRYCRYLDIVGIIPGRDPLVRRAGGGARGGAGGGAGPRLHQLPALALGAAGHRDRAQVPPCILGSAADDPSVSQSVFTIMEKAPTRAFSWLKFKTLC